MEDQFFNFDNTDDLIPQHHKNKSEYPIPDLQDQYVEVVTHATLARAYVPFQKIDQLYSPKDSLKYGTVFPELNQPESYYH